MAAAALGDVRCCADYVDRGLGLWRQTANFSIDIMLLEVIHVLMSVGQTELARKYIEQARNLYARTPERCAYAEFLRIDGLLKVEEGDRIDGQALLKQAVDTAKSQSANLFRLRASCDLARLMREDGDIEGARQALTPSYNWFTEGFKMPDLLQAKRLLDSLAR
jgi:predicted ATPase